MAELASDLRWDFPLRLLGGLHWLVLDGRASWDGVDRALDDYPEFLARFAAEQQVQTNEVQRAWALLPALLSLGVECVDLIEIGASAGLLLALDDYDYRYRAGAWGRGDGALVLAGDDRGGPPVTLLTRPLRVERRVGIDLKPVVLNDEGARLLEAFVWADQTKRIERLRRAIDVTRRRGVQLAQGDYVDVLPTLLGTRRPGVLTVVVSAVTTTYLDEERYQRLLVVLAEAGNDAPLAWLSLEAPRADRSYGATALELTTWPARETRRLARVDYHADWLEWS